MGVTMTAQVTMGSRADAMLQSYQAQHDKCNMTNQEGTRERAMRNFKQANAKLCKCIALKLCYLLSRWLIGWAYLIHQVGMATLSGRTMGAVRVATHRRAAVPEV
jgi:hypothetical protein